MTSLILAFIAYFIILLGFGLYFHKKQETSADFIMGNRSLSFWLVALSAHASDMSAWLFMAFPMYLFVLGLPHIWIGFGLVLGMLLNWHFVAPKLRSMTEGYNSYTLSSFFEKRYGDVSGGIRIFSAIVMTIFLTHYLAAGFTAMGNLLESLFGLNYVVGISIAVFVVVIYTSVGGFTTVAWVDLFQALFLLAIIIIVPTHAFLKTDGFSAITSNAQKLSIPLTWVPDDLESFIILLITALGWGLGYFGMPHIITKFMGIKDVKEMYKSKWLGMTWQVIALSAAAFVGIVGIAFFPDSLDKPEMVFVEMVKNLYTPFIVGFILCAILAANLSTMDSQILVCASIISEDIFKKITRFSRDSTLLWVSRVSVMIISLIALGLALNKSSTIADTVLYSWSGLGSAFGPLVLMSLYSKNTNRYGALAGIIVGALTVMVWPTLNPYVTRYALSPMIPGFTLSFVSIVLFSYLFRNPQKVENPI